MDRVAKQRAISKRQNSSSPDGFQPNSLFLFLLVPLSSYKGLGFYRGHDVTLGPDASRLHIARWLTKGKLILDSKSLASIVSPSG